MTSSDPNRQTGATETTAAKQRRIQREQDAHDRASTAGASREPKPKGQPAQHVDKPGTESELDPRPRFSAPDYRGSEKLAGSVALITGDDSGLGRAVAVLFAREGADVAIVYLQSHDDAKKAARHVEQEGMRCLLIAGDVKDAAFCTEAVERTVAELGQLDILVNNAAFQEHAESIDDITEERFDETMRTNVYGYFHMAKAAAKHQHLRQGGSIINTGSVTGLEGSPQLLDYSATKGAIHAFTKPLAANLLARHPRQRGRAGAGVDAAEPGRLAG